jgi:hypothetical protein
VSSRFHGPPQKFLTEPSTSISLSNHVSFAATEAARNWFLLISSLGRSACLQASDLVSFPVPGQFAFQPLSRWGSWKIRSAVCLLACWVAYGCFCCLLAAAAAACCCRRRLGVGWDLLVSIRCLPVCLSRYLSTLTPFLSHSSHRHFEQSSACSPTAACPQGPSICETSGFEGYPGGRSTPSDPTPSPRARRVRDRCLGLAGIDSFYSLLVHVLCTLRRLPAYMLIQHTLHFVQT